ncbi:MAG: hypothetical protein JXA30_19340 [Deltaproteobacteria bacterium]|nr:hypothetical protein [Deltaproteobacteria bacterium]
MRFYRIIFAILALQGLFFSSCSGLSDDKGPNGSGESGVGGTEPVVASENGGDVAVENESESGESGAGGTIETGGNGPVTADGGTEGGASQDASIRDAGREGGTAGIQTDSAAGAADGNGVNAEGGSPNANGAGSCCEVHAEPGCNDAQTQSCVCEKLPDCCTNTWDLPCTLIVIQKYCEPGIRECVCGPAANGGWEQTQCCEVDWTDFCKETAIIKCGAKAGC